MTSLQTVLTCTKLVSPKVMAQIVKFIYTGEIERHFTDFNDLKQVFTSEV